MFIEIPVLLLFFAFLNFGSIATNLTIFRTCYVILGYNKTECALLGTQFSDNATIHLEKIVEPHASVISMTHSVINAFISGVLCLFVGSWSDRFGRKPILTIPLLGFSIAFASYAIFAAFDSLSPWYGLLCFIPVYVTGGFSCYLTVVMCYITDITSEASRGLRMGIFEGTLTLGIFLGNLSSSYVFTATNYSTVFFISSLCCLAGFLYTVFLIPETRNYLETEGRFKELFVVSYISDMFKAAVKKRGGYDRFCTISLVIMLALFILVVNGEEAVTFLFLREKFHWSLKQYTLYSALNNVIWVFGTILGIYGIHKLLKIPESVMILIGFISMFNGMIVIGIAKSNYDIYFASTVRSLGGTLSPMVRSLVSKIVPLEEIGKIFSLIVIGESIFGMLGSPIYTAIYNETIALNPSIFNFFSAGVYLIEIFIAIAVIYLRTKSRNEINYTELESENREIVVSSDE